MTAVLSAEFCATAPIAKVSGSDLQVPLVQGGECSYANFDYAASAPGIGPGHGLHRRIAPTYASVHRGAGNVRRPDRRIHDPA
jgi:hypothetical protein